jgi:septum site-determining protein MinD
MGKIYIITSGKGGTGKTTTTINLAAALNKLHEDVIIVDANLTTPNLSLYLGAPMVPISFSHVLQGKAELDDALYEHDSGIKIMPASLSLRDLKKITEESVIDASKKMKKMAKHIIFDSSAGLGKETMYPMNNSDEVILVVNPNILSVTDALKTIKLAEEAGRRIKGIILTRVGYSKYDMPLKSILEMLEYPILGIVPEDKLVHAALSERNAVVYAYPRSKASRSYMNIAAKMVGKRRIPSLYERTLMRLGLSKGVK